MRTTILAGFFLITAFSINNQLHAQAKGPVTPVRVGSVTLNLGAGPAGDYRDNYYRGPFGAKAAVEWGLWKAGPGAITLGAQMGGTFSTGGGPRNGFRGRTLVIGARSAWHYGWKVKGLDTYGGFSTGMGFYRRWYKDYDDVYTEVFPVFGAFIGASYFVSPVFGFNAEAGFDITNFQMGIIFKFK